MTVDEVVNERIARRRAEVRSQRRRRRLRRTLVITAALVLLAGLVALERSSLVALSDVQVTGLDRLAEREVLDAAAVPLGTSVLRIDLDAITERVEAMPFVADAEVTRDGPLGLVIAVTEAAPALTARYDREELLVSGGGVVLGPGQAPGTPLVDLSGPVPATGDHVEVDPALATAHQVLLGLSGPLEALVAQARASAADDLVLQLESGTLVRWGDATRGQEKARALGAVLEDLDDRVVEVIDVRAPMAPTVTD